MSDNNPYWQLLENEGRFNTIQATIRGIAATWMLATIASLGLVLRSDPNAPVWQLARGDLMLAVLTASSLGLLLLWILDLMVYQKLLGAGFVLRLYMEFRDASIPPLGAAMMASSNWKGMTPVFRYFYSIPAGVFGLIGVLALGAAEPHPGSLAGGSIGLLARVLAVGVQLTVFGMIAVKSKSSSISLPKELKDERFSALFSQGRAELSPVLEAYGKHTPTRRSWPYDAMVLPEKVTAVAPDGSDVRVLLGLSGGGMAHFALPRGEVSTAVMHKTVEEIWFILSGAGEMWRRQDGREEMVELRRGTCLTLPLGTAFQFRSTDERPLTALGVTMPPWPGDGEAVIVEGRWEPTVP
jgi:mannose-6-phosphate isomerase-like protein (cupin superfamily)